MKYRDATILSAITLCIVGGVSTAQEDQAESEAPSGLEILKHVDKAIKAVSAVGYTATSMPSGIATNFVSAATGSGVMEGWNGSTAERFYAKVSTTRPGSDDTIEIEGGGDGNSYFLIDHSSKKAYEDMDPLVMGSSGDTLGNLGMVEYVHPTPYDDELNADTVELEGEETVGDVACYRIRVVYAGGQGQSTWFFGKKDYLPRRRIRHFNIPGQGEGSLDIVLTELVVGPELDSSRFKLVLPEGYEQVDDFAP